MAAPTTFLRFSKYSQRIILQTTKISSLHSSAARTIVPRTFSTSSSFPNSSNPSMRDHDRNQLLDENNRANILGKDSKSEEPEQDKKHLLNPNDRNQWFIGHPIARYTLMGAGAAVGLYLSFKIIKASVYLIGLAAIGGTTFYVYRRLHGTHRPLDQFIAKNAKELAKQGGAATKDTFSMATATAGNWMSRAMGTKSSLDIQTTNSIFEDVTRATSTSSTSSKDDTNASQEVPPTKPEKNFDSSDPTPAESTTKRKKDEFKNKESQAGGREFSQESSRLSRDTAYSKGADGRVWEQAKQDARDAYKDWKRSEKKAEHKPTTDSKREFTTSSTTSDYLKDKAQQIEKKVEQVSKEAKDKAQQAWQDGSQNAQSKKEQIENDARSTADSVKESVKEKAQQAWEGAKDTASAGKEKAQQAWEGAKDTASAGKEKMEALKDKAEKAKETVQNAWENVKETVKETIGTKGNQTPPTKNEDDMKQTAEQIKQDASEKAQQAKETVKDKTKEALKGAQQTMK